MATPSLTSPRVCIPGYTVGERLGQGTYATVYKCTSIAVNPNMIRETVAVKCIEKRKITSSKAGQDNLIQEISILKKLRHRHIVQLVDFLWDANYIYLVTEFCSGGDLSSFIRQQRKLPEHVTRKFLRQLASAMKYLRSQDISHMDLKPQNLLLSSRYKPVLKVADFGFAQHLQERGDLATSFKGSPLYMAPEIFAHQHYDARVDLWSIGVILYECLFGRAPFACASMEELVKQITSSQKVVIPDNAGLPVACRDLLEGLLRRNPNHRLTFDEFFSHPYVDMDTAPTDTSLARATELAQNAMQKEKKGRVAKAIELYSQAIEQFMAAVQYTEDENEKKRLRITVHDYLKRAEKLKGGLRDQLQSPSVTSEKSITELDQLHKMWNDTPQVQAAFTVVGKAEKLAEEELFAQSLDKYQLAVQSMLQLLNSEEAGKRKEILQRQVGKWLDRSEQLQGYIHVQNLNLSKMEERSKLEIAVEADTENLASNNQCVLQ